MEANAATSLTRRVKSLKRQLESLLVRRQEEKKKDRRHVQGTRFKRDPTQPPQIPHNTNLPMPSLLLPLQNQQNRDDGQCKTNLIGAVR
ncbi:hypothetical protein XA68_13008 [Ophiocordyceps unilateralis]|uniref:Uncharacterized protein n=1 Tax=Ophiocordyceps unilateralis TaxID=268505 RepID=A0A2A9PMK5_OPHUN|nr:hypothetical protein XA68_13008 [Ophiocordyceps unilateralis]